LACRQARPGQAASVSLIAWPGLRTGSGYQIAVAGQARPKKSGLLAALMIMMKKRVKKMIFILFFCLFFHSFF
jgi:hypothetical protein